jgi:hypothetical protein
MQPGADAGGQAGRARADPGPTAFHGQRGKLRQAYREDQLGVLGLVLNAVVLWNTGYIDAAVAGLRSSSHPVAGEDAARLSPFGDSTSTCWAGIPPPRRHPAACARCATPSTPGSDQDERYDHR